MLDQHSILDPLRIALMTNLSAIALMHDIAQSVKFSPDGRNALQVARSFVETIEKLPEQNIVDPRVSQLLSRMLAPCMEMLKLNYEPPELNLHSKLEMYRNLKLSKTDPTRIYWCNKLADGAYKNKDYDLAIQLLREGLSIPTTKIDQANLYRKLCKIYNQQKNWLATIECCRDNISMPQLPPNSIYIVEAYMHCGAACDELGDYSEAFVNYSTALELLHQHHPPRHPLTITVQLRLGILFVRIGNTAAAMEHFQHAIDLDLCELTGTAHMWISQIYSSMRQYEKTRFHLLQCLNIRQQHFSSNTNALLRTYLALIQIEQITGHHEQRNLYLQQGLYLADSTEARRDYFSKETQRILNIPSPFTP